MKVLELEYADIILNQLECSCFVKRDYIFLIFRNSYRRNKLLLYLIFEIKIVGEIKLLKRKKKTRESKCEIESSRSIKISASCSRAAWQSTMVLLKWIRYAPFPQLIDTGSRFMNKPTNYKISRCKSFHWLIANGIIACWEFLLFVSQIRLLRLFTLFKKFSREQRCYNDGCFNIWEIFA